MRGRTDRLAGAALVLVALALPLLTGACAQPTDVSASARGADEAEPREEPDTESRSVAIDFDTATEGVVATGFSGLGAGRDPEPGQLDADAWQVLGMSDGDRLFGEEAADGDHARGRSEGGVSSGGLYAFQVEDGNVALGVQATATDFSPGSIVLRLPIDLYPSQTLTLGYTMWVRNDEDRSSRWEVAYSLDGDLWSEPDLLPFATGAIAADSASWESYPFRLEGEVEYDETAGDDGLYVRWSAVEHSGTGGRDEVAIDDIVVTLEPTRD